VKLVDPICTFLFSLVVLVTTLSVLRDATHVLMEGFPRHLDYTAIVNALRAVDGVRTVHNLHVWSLTLNKNALAVHLSVGELLSKLCGWFADSLHLITLKNVLV
jgi:zinc transporter 2